MFERLTGLASRRPRRVVASGALIAVAAAILGGNVAQSLGPYGADDPATDSARSDALVQRATGLAAGTGLLALVETPDGPKARTTRAELARVARTLRADAAVGRVTTTYSGGGADLIARDGRSQYVAAQYKNLADDEQQDAAERLADRFGDGNVKIGGAAHAQAEVNHQVESDLRRAELLAFPLLFLLSLLFFRSAVAALLPLLVGGFAIVGTFLALKVANEFTDVSVFALNLTTGLGLGLAIDYSLFMVARYREELAKDVTPAAAIGRTLQTAGRTVLFSSLTVAAALASLLVFPQRFLYSMGLGGSLVTVLAASVALLFLPAVLVLLGHRVNSLAPRWLQRRADRDTRPESAGFWYRLSRLVMRRPATIAAVSAAVLLVAGLPFLRIAFTSIDTSVLPTSAESRQVDIALKRDFAAGPINAVTLAVDAPPSPALRAYARRLGDLPGAAGVSPVRPAGRTASLIEVYPRGEPFAASSTDLVRDIRARGAPAEVFAGGQSAQFIDLRHSLTEHLPLALGIVILATFVVLFLMTGSVVLPFKAVLMNALTLSATFGLLVLIFQDGRFEDLLGYTSQGTIEMTMPVLLFAVVFGLSTDYGVFLLSRIKEARDAGASDSESVAVGLERTGRIVTAAALLFSIAIGAFATSEIIFIKQNGVGTAIAVLIDATIIRALLVPSLMELLGHWNWWAPAPLRRLHERIGLSEGGGPPPPATATPSEA